MSSGGGGSMSEAMPVSSESEAQGMRASGSWVRSLLSLYMSSV